MKAPMEISSQQFHQQLQYHSMITLPTQPQPLPLYKLSIRPYDYYIQYTFTSPITRLHFYQELQTLSTLIVSPQHVSMDEEEGSYFDQWFGLAEKNNFSITCFFKYYNYTLRHWMEHQKNCRSVISEQEILMVFKQLLTFQKVYQQYYQHDCGIFKAQLIFITPEKCLKIYPQSIEYTGQISVKKAGQVYLNSSMAKIDKQASFETTLSNSRAQIQTTSEADHGDSGLNRDLRDIFILVLQLVSLKRHDHFYSQKHSMIIWDAVNSVLNSIQVSHLSHSFLSLLKKCASLKELDSIWMLTEVDKIISQKDQMCKTIHIEKNQQLVELVLKRVETEKCKKLQELKVLGNSELKKTLTRSIHSL